MRMFLLKNNMIPVCLDLAIRLEGPILYSGLRIRKAQDTRLV